MYLLSFSNSSSKYFTSCFLLVLFFTFSAFSCKSQKELSTTTYFKHIEYSSNGKVSVKGESFENEVKNGEWQFFDEQGRVIRLMRYRNNDIVGPVAYFRYYGSAQIIKEEGLLNDGKRMGLWSTYEKGKTSDWFRSMHVVYNEKEQLISKVLYHPNGIAEIEVFMNEKGEAVFYKKYDQDGQLLFAGEKLPLDSQ